MSERKFFEKPINGEAKEMEDAWKLDNLGLTPKERSIVDAVSTDAIKTVKKLFVDNLRTHPNFGNIIGFRSEDIIFFLQACQQGFLPVSPEADQVAFRVKIEETEGTHAFFMTKNTGNIRDVMHNVANYSYESAISAAIHRNILPFISQEAVDRIKTDFAQEDGNAEFSIEAFFQEIRHLIESEDGIPNASTLLGKYLPQSAPKKALNTFLRSVKKRSAVCIGFDTSIEHGRSRIQGHLDDDTEIILAVPDNRIPLTNIVGIESMGDFVDKILAYLYYKTA